jgi:hypothetical protein
MLIRMIPVCVFESVMNFVTHHLFVLYIHIHLCFQHILQVTFGDVLTRMFIIHL